MTVTVIVYIYYMRNDLQIGVAGEHIVCADLILKGFNCFMSEQGLPYDLIVDIGGVLKKVQVKSTLKPRKVKQRAKDTFSYVFDVKRCGKRGGNTYNDIDVDLFAFVCLDNMTIGYIESENIKSTLTLRVDELRGCYYDEKGVANYERVIELLSKGHSQTYISKKINLSQSTVNKMAQKGYKPHKTNAMYFSDIQRNSDWFTKQE